MTRSPTLVLVLPFADAQAMVRRLDGREEITLISFPRSIGARELAATLGARLKRHVEREAPVSGFERPWYGACRNVAERSVAAALDLLEACEAGAAARRHALMLVNALTIDFIAAASERLDVEEALAHEAEREGREGRARQIVFACGSLAQLGCFGALGAEAGAGLIVAAAQDAQERELMERLLETAGRTEPVDPGGARDALARALRDVQGLVRVPKLAGARVICADFRSQREFRYLATARSICEAAQERGPVRLLQQYNRVSKNVMRLFLRTLAESRGRRRLALMRSVHSLRAPTPCEAWGAAFAAIMADEARVEPGLQGLFCAGEAQGEAQIEAQGEGGAQAAVAAAVARKFALGRMVTSIAQAEAVREAFLRDPPKWVAFVPESQPFAMNVVSGARAAGTPTIAIHTLLIGKSMRECRPIAEWIGCMDDSHARHLVAHFGAEASQIGLIGNIGIDKWREASARLRMRPHAPDAVKRIVYVAQPVPELTRVALDWIIQAVAARDDLALDIHLHPDERRALRREYEHMAAAAGAGERIGVRGIGTKMSTVMTADVLATLDSNHGYRAGVLGQRVLVVDPSADGLPINLDEMGVAVRARSRESCRAMLYDLVDGRLDETLAASRRVFLAANPQLAAGEIGARVVEMAERAAAGP